MGSEMGGQEEAVLRGDGTCRRHPRPGADRGYMGGLTGDPGRGHLGHTPSSQETRLNLRQAMWRASDERRRTPAVIPGTVDTARAVSGPTERYRHLLAGPQPGCIKQGTRSMALEQDDLEHGGCWANCIQPLRFKRSAKRNQIPIH